ncbi:MAG: hypothetical protein HPY82_05685 [Gammaproteobacteria bacterium]|nr:hypothetical protein [Gammaproteobacteria bacterium]
MPLVTGPMLVGGVLYSGAMFDSAPVFSSSNLLNANNWAATTHQVQVTAGSVLSLVAPVLGVSLNAGTGVVTFDFRGMAGGNRTFTLRATYGGVSTDQVVTVVVDARPVFFGATTLNVSAGAITPIVIEAQDPEGATLTLSAIQMPSGLVFTPAAQPSTTGNGVVYTGTISGTLAGGVHTCQIRATAANGGGSTDHTLTINVASVANQAPVITSSPTMTVIQGQVVQRTLTANDANGDTISWSFSSSNSWITRTGDQVAAAPGIDIQPGPYQAFVTANDGQLTTNQTITVTVVAASVESGASVIEFTTPARRTLTVGRLDRQAAPTFEQDSAERYDYLVDLRRWLELDTLASVEWSTTPGLDYQAGGFNAGQCVVWLSNGTAGLNYKVTAMITTVGGRTHKAWFFVSMTVEDS